jgi:hypothetical protein
MSLPGRRSQRASKGDHWGSGKTDFDKKVAKSKPTPFGVFDDRAPPEVIELLEFRDILPEQFMVLPARLGEVTINEV